MLMLIRSLPLAMVKGAAIFVLCGTVLCQVVQHCGSGANVIYVHVTHADVDVTVDGTRHHVYALEQSPVVCDVRPGRHVLRMMRGERILYEEEFSLEPGEERVMVAWDRSGEADGHRP